MQFYVTVLFTSKNTEDISLAIEIARKVIERETTIARENCF